MAIAHSLAELRKNSKDEIADLKRQADKLTTTYAKDPRYWVLEKDGHGNGSAVIRFLPKPPGEENEFTRLWSYSFQGSGGAWYINLSRQSMDGQDDPVAKFRNKLFRSALESDKELASKLKRRLQFVSNILVIRDKAHPENEGRVFLYSYGIKMFERLDGLTKPAFEDQKPVNPFSLFNGVNLRLRVKKNSGGFFDYSDSEFDSPSPVAKTDEEIEKIWKSCYSLKELLEEKNFKSYSELEQRMNEVLSLDTDPFLKGSNAATPAPRQREIPAAYEVQTGSSHTHAEESPPWPTMEDTDEDLLKFRMALEKDD